MAAKKRREKGTGALFQRKDGRWTGRVYLGPGQRPKEVTKTTKQEAQQAMRDIERLHERGVNVHGKVQTVAQFFARWLDDVKAPNVRPGTLVSYRLHLNHVASIIGATPLHKVTAQQLQQTFTQLRRNGLAASTVNLTRTCTIQVFRTAEHWDLIPYNVAMRTTPLKVPTAHRPVLTPAEGIHLCTVADEHTIGMSVRLALYMGLRRGEMLGLRWSDVDMTAKKLHVRTQVQRVGGIYEAFALKTDNAWRTLPLPPAIIAALHTQRARQAQWKLLAGTRWDDHDLVCTTPKGKPIPFTTLTEHFHAAVRDARLPRMRFHDLRHSCASMLAANNTHLRVMQAILGHADITTTAGYTHIIDIGQLDDAIGELDAAMATAHQKEVG